MKKLRFVFGSLILLGITFANSVFADPPSGGGVNIVKLENPFKFGNDLYSFVEALINGIVLPLGGMLCVLAFIYAGFLYVKARGNEDEIKNAHRAFLYSAIGTAILLGAWAIANAVRATIGQLQ